MSLKQRVSKQNYNGNFLVNEVTSPTCRSRGLPPSTRFLQEGYSDTDNKRLQTLADTLGTLPRARKQLALSRSNSLVDSNGSERRIHVLMKQDNQTFGFEIQTHVSNHQNANAQEICTYVCKVHDGSPAHSAGLNTSDILVNINGVNIEGFSHHEIVTHIKSSGNFLRLETVTGTIIRKLELEAKLRHLKNTLREKREELKSLHLKEQRLLHSINSCRISESMESPETNMCGSNALHDAGARSKHRFSSESSCKSQLSFMTDDSDDGMYQTCVFDDSACDSPCRRASIDEEYFFTRDIGMPLAKPTLRRNRSISVASTSSGSTSPSWDIPVSNYPNIFGTLPRKTRNGSVRRRLMKFIPGLNRSVEEEESRF